MLHADELDEALSEQIALRNRAISVESHFENLGVCVDCLTRVANEWLDENKIMLIQAVVQGDTDDPLTLLGLTSFICGFGLGHVIGSGVTNS